MEFNEQQLKAVNAMDGNVSVIATAGSGKTTVLTHRIKNMVIGHRCTPNSILAVTFSKKAKESISSKLHGLGITGVNIETFHSLALKIIISAYGVNRYKVWTAPWEKERMIRDICVNRGLCQIKDVPYNKIVSFIALQKTNMLNPGDSLVFNSDIPFPNKDMQEIYRLYEKMKDEKSYIEFNDFLNMANDIFDQLPEIRETYRERFQYVLSDEFQDISLSQSILLKKINTSNTMIVGDPLQAIYSFRGGDSRYILNFNSDYPDTEVINLNTNYRCSEDIVRTSNALAKRIPDSKHKNYVESIADRPKGKPPELHHFESDYSEVDWVTEKITELSRIYGYNDIAILARTNAQLQKFETGMHQKAIPYDVVNGRIFAELPEIKLILSYLKLSFDENDNDAFRYLYNKPNRWLDKKFLLELEQNSIRRDTSLYNAMFTIDRRNWKFRNGIDEIHEVINCLQNKSFMDVGKMIHYLRNRMDIDEFSAKGKQSDDGSYLEQVQNLDGFENMCESYTSIKQLLFSLQGMEKDRASDTKQKVKLLTIHRSKGLEYPVVFVVGCNEGLLPHYKNTNINDERRLFYVAITRAEKELFFSYSDVVNGKFLNRSPFIADISSTISIAKDEENSVRKENT